MFKKEGGVSVNLVSRQKMEQLSSTERLRYILDEVRKGKILVLEQGLTSVEQAKLIEQTMKEIQQDTFIGIEMDGYGEEKPSFIQKMFGGIRKPRMTVIGPANLFKTISKDSHIIQTMVIAGKGAK